MIPPVEERQVRPCEDCILYYDDDGCIPTCNLDSASFNKRFVEPMHIFDKTPSIKDYPCIYHLTHEEYHELLNTP